MAICAWACVSFGNLVQRMHFPLPCGKTSDVSQTSDVCGNNCGGDRTGRPSKILLIQLLRFWQDCVVGRRCNQVLLQCSMQAIAKELL